ncbi:progranulin-like [Panonychus citri]|uniref:progranulin-like n=1 Tax=Panonychus citri TaxID=50023 RepID=UPI002307C3BC|nr:progranulin-like [Panonychus citri]
MYFAYLTGILFTLIVTTPTKVTSHREKCIGLNCSQGITKIRIVGELEGSNYTKTCPDNRTICEDDETCCAVTIGGYGCCDPDHSKCCGDGVHCCPNDRVVKPKIHRIPLVSSNVKSTLGQLNRVDVDLFNSSSSIGTQCPGSSFECQSQNTCCKDPQGSWACCPYPSANCCSDGLHCCPNGYKCRLDLGKCVRSNKKTISPRK